MKKDGRFLVQIILGVKPDGKRDVKSKSFNPMNNPNAEADAYAYADELTRKYANSAVTAGKQLHSVQLQTYGLHGAFAKRQIKGASGGILR
jgi:hypothetical protein